MRKLLIFKIEFFENGRERKFDVMLRFWNPYVLLPSGDDVPNGPLNSCDLDMVTIDTCFCIRPSPKAQAQ